MKLNGNEISKDFVAKAMACDTPEALVALAKESGVELSKEEAAAYLSEMEDVDLDFEHLRKVAGGYGPDDDICSLRGVRMCKGH